MLYYVESSGNWITLALSLILSMALRFVPRFMGQLKVIRNGQKAMGRDVSEGSLLKRIRLAGFTIFWYEAPVDASSVLAVFTYICFGIFCFLPVILDVTETIRFSRNRKKKTTDLEKTYREIYEEQKMQR